MNTSTNSSSIGIFDSGVGGLSAVRALKKLGATFSIEYFGDTARVPYGTRDEETIVSYARQDLRFLLSKNVSAVLVACGTVSSVALDSLRMDTDIPIYGIVDAAAVTAVHKTKNGKVAVLATEATVNSHAFSKAVQSKDNNIGVIEIPCPLFVPLVENGYIERDNAVTRLVANEYLKDVITFGADTVILGCTHFPLLKELLTDLLPGVCFIDSSYEAAAALQREIQEDTTSSIINHNTYYISGSIRQFEKVSKIFMGEDSINDIQRISLADYAV